MATIPASARALLDAIAGGESAGAYDVIYGGGKFNDFSDHPRQFVTIASGPNKGQKSSAAGKYQFLGSTWDEQAAKLGLTDFSPASQDAAAWNLAQETYRAKTGRDLLADLEAGDTSRVASALRDTWTSLPGGIEQGATAAQFSTQYGNALGAGASGNALSAPATGNAFSTRSLATREAPAWVGIMAPPQLKFEPLSLPSRRRA